LFSYYIAAVYFRQTAVCLLLSVSITQALNTALPYLFQLEKKKKTSLSTYLGHKSELKMNFLFFKTNRALLLVYLVVSNSWSFVLKHKARLWAVYETWTLHFVSEMLFHSRWTELKGNT